MTATREQLVDDARRRTDAWRFILTAVQQDGAANAAAALHVAGYQTDGGSLLTEKIGACEVCGRHAHLARRDADSPFVCLYCGLDAIATEAGPAPETAAAEPAAIPDIPPLASPLGGGPDQEAAQ